MLGQVYNKSSHSRGYGVKCPRDGLPNCATVDALFVEHRAAQATHFPS